MERERLTVERRGEELVIRRGGIEVALPASQASLLVDAVIVATEEGAEVVGKLCVWEQSK